MNKSDPQQRRELQEIAAELRAVAAFGLNFARNPHDEARYKAVLSASARIDALFDDQTPPDLLREYEENAFKMSAWPSGEAAVLWEDRLLLVRRGDDGLWALPGGITDPGETLAQSASRELWEEAGISGRVHQLLGIYDSRLWHSEKKVHFYHAVFLIEAAHPQPTPGVEVLDARYFGQDELPPLSPGHHLRVPFVFKQLRGDAPIPYFDPITQLHQ